MSSYINRGESVFFQFRNGKSVMNSQCKPRMFKTAEKATLGVNYIDTDEIVEYAEVKRGEWIETEDDEIVCSVCGIRIPEMYSNADSVLPSECRFCHYCGADMREVDHD